jgi:S1-C subfamily serine protease
VPFDDDAADDVTGFGPPPHPDDRLWRHPSELFGSGPTLARVTAHRWPWGLVAGAGTIGVMLVGAGAFMVGLRDRVVNGRAPAQAAIAPLGSEPPTEIDRPGMFAGPIAGQSSAAAVAPSIVRIDGVASGSGIIVRSDGIVLTTASVVGNLPDVQVTFDDGNTATGTNLGGDPVTNVAVVDLAEDGFAAAQLVAPKGLTPGDAVVCTWVTDTGSLLAAQGTLANAKAHARPPDRDPLDGVLQITADPNAPTFLPGGAVIDGKGAVLALITWADDDWIYATPIDVAAKIADDLLATGSAQHGWIGIEGEDAAGGRGVVVADVYDGSPVADSLRDDDVITEVDGQSVTDMSTLVGLLQLYRPGDQVDVTYSRGGETDDVEVTLEPVPTSP